MNGINDEYPLYDKEMHKFYRMDGYIKEYAPTVMTTHGTVYESELKQINERAKKDSQNIINEAATALKPYGTCPFKSGSAKPTCDSNCAWWNGSECSIVSDRSETKLKGKCPISKSTCTEICALWKDNECKLLAKRMSG